MTRTLTALTALCLAHGIALAAPTATSTSLIATPNQALLGQTVTLTATVTGSSPTGKVTFYQGPLVLGVRTLLSGVATLTTTLAPISGSNGAQSFTAFYQGDSTHATSTSAAAVITINARPSRSFQAPGGTTASLTNTLGTYGVLADFNRDGIADVATASGSAADITLGNGDGTFRTAPGSPFDYRVSTGVVSVLDEGNLAVGDFDGDGIPDLATIWHTNVFGVNSYYLRILIGNGDGSFHLGAGSAFLTNTDAAREIVVADFNRDGNADLAILNQGPGSGPPTVYFLAGQGDGTFAFPIPSAFGATSTGQSAVVGDFNNDGIPDIALVAAVGAFKFPWILQGDGTGGFTGTYLSSVTGSPSWIATGDFNGDGLPDLVFVNTSGGVRAVLNSSASPGTFTQTAISSIGAQASTFIAVGDFDGDGKLDVLALAPGNQAVVAPGQGNGLFGSPTTISLGTSPMVPLVGEFNGDSRQDFGFIDTGGNTFTVRLGVGPGITTLNPTSTVAGATNFTLTINGSGFVSGDVVKWAPNGGTVQSLTGGAVSGLGSQITIPIPANLLSLAGTASVSVSDATNSAIVSNAATFTIGPPPQISSLSQTTAAQGGTGLSLVIAGSGFAVNDTLRWQPAGGNPQSLSGTPNQAGTSFTVAIPSALLASLGTVQLTVVDPSSVASNSVQFTIQPPPTLSNLQPAGLPAGSSATQLTINGSGFVTGDVVSWKPTAGAVQGLTGGTVTGGNQISIQIPANLLTTIDTNVQISVVDPDGATSNALSFSVAGPVLSGVVPTSLGTGATNVSMTVTGQNFVTGATTSVVRIAGPGGTQNLTPTSISSTQATVIVPGALIGTTPGTAQVAVVNPGGSTSAAIAVPVAAPTISAVNPPSAASGGNLQLSITISGTNFVAASKVLFCNGCNGVPDVLTTTFSSSTLLSAIIPVQDLTAVGSATITVTNNISNPTDPNTLSNAVTFPISALTVSSISPSSVLAGSQSFTMTLSGQNFGSAAVILIGSQPPLTPDSISPTLITATIPASYIASPGVFQIVVKNPNGAVSPAVNLTVGQLSITNVAPSPIVAGSPSFTLSITGTSFSSGVQIQWSAGTTTNILGASFIDPQHLTAIVPSNLVQQAGSALLTAISPSANVSSAPVSVTISGPAVVSLNPSNSGVGVATFALQVQGFNFLSGSTVQWSGGTGQAQALQTTFVDAQNLTALVPASLVSQPGTALVSVLNPGGGGTGATSNGVIFRIGATPTINTTNGLTPGTVLAGSQSFQLQIQGTNYQLGAQAQWSVNGTTVNLATAFVDAQHLTAQVPANLIAAPASPLIIVQNPGGQASNGVLFPVGTGQIPTLTSLSPASGITVGGPTFQLDLTGSNFLSGAVVNWATGATSLALTTIFVDASHLSAIVPATAITNTGTAFVNVVNPGGSASGSLPFSINALAAVTITSLDQSTATAGSATFTLGINGQTFQTGSVAQWNAGSGAQPLATSYVGPAKLQAIIPASLLVNAGTAFVTVLNTGGVLSNAAMFTVTALSPPSIATNGLTPAAATAGSGAFQLAVAGSGFVAGSSLIWNAGSGAQTLATIFVDSAHLTAVVPAAMVATAGTAFLSVQNPGGLSSGVVAFTVSAVPLPAISSITPSTASTGSTGITMSVQGSNFVNGVIVQWNTGGTAQALTTGFKASTDLVAIVPASLLTTASTALISVLNPDKTVSNSLPFVVSGPAPVSAPTLTSIAPAAAAAGSGQLQITVTGTNFSSGSGGTTASAVQWNGTAVPTTFVSATQLTAVIDATFLQQAGADFVTVVTGAFSSSGVKFTVNGPVLSALTPASATAGGPAFALTLAGGNFVTGSVASWNGTNLATSAASATQLTAQVPATLIAAAGNAFVVVTNPGGAASAPVAFAVSTPPASTVTGLNPPSAVAGAGAFSLSVVGSGFVNGSLVMWNGSPLATGFVSATQVVALVDSTLIASAGSANVTVQNPGAAASNTMRMAINGPTVTSLSPASAAAGDPPFSLTLTGTNFVPGSTVQWNGTALPTAYISATQLLASVAAANVAQQSAISVTVQNPGGAVAASASFTVGAPSLRIATAALGDGVVGTFYSLALQAQGGTPPYKWSVTAGALPDALGLDGTSGTISGTPTGAANATVGITVTDSSGRTSAQSFLVRIAQALTITTASPLTPATAGKSYSLVLAATGGSPSYLWSLAGDLPVGMTLNVATGEIFGLPATPGGAHFTISVTDARRQQTAFKVFDLAVLAPSLTLSGLSTSLSAAQQVPLTVTVPSAYPVDLTGTLTLSLTSAVGGDDPSVQFTTGGRGVSFTIPAGSTSAVFGQNQQVLVSTGTVAGAITIAAALRAGASDITPSPAPQISGTVAKGAPVITSVTLKRSTGGVTVGIVGYSTAKEVKDATLVFNAAQGATLNAAPLTVSLANVIAGWYQGAAAATFGSQFSVSIPLNVSGDVTAIGSVTVTLSDSLGSSNAVTSALQ